MMLFDVVNDSASYRVTLTMLLLKILSLVFVDFGDFQMLFKAGNVHVVLDIQACAYFSMSTVFKVIVMSDLR